MKESAPGSQDIGTVVAVDSLGAAGILVSLFDYFTIQKRPLLGLDPIGVAIFLMGVAVELSAVRALGRQYSLRVKTTEEQKLIQAGPYRYIRHPVYLGLILVFFSAPIAWVSLYGALIALPTIPLLLKRIRVEERAMAFRFGDEYTAYVQRTKRLIPLVY
ncbi:MAG: isoprenylcysteine carboxylmethyltransferase family protein [Thaumarchaeota archaeon]|nr:isoprenylcysteine carboxylmethyltransferase family protein [Nitrososphaerota archaeon]